MANIITEVFVSVDGLNYVKLDLHKDESLNLKFTKKDLQDLSKIFAPFSQGFTFPATGKNRAAFGFFGDTDVIKINKESKFPAKLYTGGILNQTGFVKLEGLTYVNKKPTDFSGSFASNMTNLKDKIGDDYLSDITDEPVSVIWDYEGVQNMVKSEQSQIVDGVNVKYFVPLVSINRVWGYDLADNSQILDNIAYMQSTQPDSFNLIRPEELRPVLYYSTILDFIKKKYGLTIISPLEERQEYKDLTVWCNAERIVNNNYTVLPILKQFGSRGKYDTKNEGGVPSNKKYSVTADLPNNTVNIYKSPTATRNEWIHKSIFFKTTFNAVSITGDNADTPSVNVQIVRASDDVVLLTDNFELEGTEFVCEMEISDDLWGDGDDLEFYIKVQFLQPTSWSTCDLRAYWRYYDGKSGWFSRTIHAWYYHQSTANNNSNFISTNKVDLIKSLPKMKVVDFLASHFKAFNISVLDTSPDSSELFWLTPEDIESSGNNYSKAVIDYTRFVNMKTHKKEKPNNYNYYNFKHASSDYFSNKKYIEAFDLEYGQTVYPETRPDNAQEFKVETDFSIIPPISVKGATGLVTAYGFTDDDPEVLDTGETRYAPNYDELTVFYAHGSTECATLAYLGIKSTRISWNVYRKEKGVYALTGYMKVTPVNKNGYSFGFSALKFNGTEFPNSLYLRYYADQTARLLDPNVLSQSFELNLPPSEIYLSESSTANGTAKTPEGFRLQNDIIIGENRFSIVDATIDITTGKAKMKFLNY